MGSALSTFSQDVRFTFRILRKSPAVTLAAVLSLALGIGANVTVFSWAQTFVLRPISGVADQQGLVVIDGRSLSGQDVRLSYPDYEEIARSATSFSGVLSYAFRALSLSYEERAERVWAELVSGNFFEVLGLRAGSGRLLNPADAQRREPVAVISDAFWERRFRRDPTIVGRTVPLSGRAFTIVGVAPPDFRGAFVGLTIDVWVPAATQETLVNLARRDVRDFGCLARLAPGATLGSAQAELTGLSKRLEREFPATNDGHRFLAFRLRNAPWGATNVMRPITGVLSGVVLLVLLIACANVANLLMARALGRRREVAIRVALGAGRARLVRQLLVESLVLASFAGALGALLASFTANLFLLFIPATPFPVGFDFRIDLAWLGFALLVTLATGLLFGLIPALQATSPALATTLKDEAGATFGGGARKVRLRSGLVVLQVALSLVLLIAAALFLQAFAKAEDASPGFEPRNVLLASLDLTPKGFSPEKTQQFLKALVTKIEAMPGVSSASLARRLPLNFGGKSTAKVDIDGYAPAKGEEAIFGLNRVGPRYLQTLRIGLAAGREFTDADDARAPDVAIVSEAAARRYWPNGDALGNVMRVSGRPLTVVGIAKDSKYYALNEGPTPYAFLPILQSDRPDVILHIRTLGDPASLVAALRRQIAELEPTLPLFDVKPMTEHMAIPLFGYRLAASLLGVFGLLALVLAGVGLYGVIAYAVKQRTQEVGLRMALGAQPSQIVQMVVGQGMGLTLLGIGAGLLAAGLLTRLFASLLYGVGANDPLTFTGVALVLAMVAFLVSYLPARQASRIDPMKALRNS